MDRTLDRQKLKERIHELYRAEHVEMGERGTIERLERGRDWDLAPTPAAGGVVVFPHAVSWTAESGRATRVSAGEDPSQWQFWGIQGPGIEGERSGAATTH